ncbi:penicillin-binding protein 1A [Caminicella sporogenes DSM 14501]|uniref:Penicillin-binding protein 1A n=1 Tax=Caminicella sporogenes DSM 14501 TaxID=1121266 RepID=A0A1M6T776_9FIRM|nr:PBP1A family penicillin-binding protein [Caminicella sporogenes]RKD26083.1 hypothetical protein BET04_11060 [Caminicella sporogenes]SHK52800.1 penicillin-binding protein 1A [Caminicella sporogenes DSM 14501]
MTENNQRRSKQKKEKKNKKRKLLTTIKILLVFFIILSFVGAGAVTGLVVAALKDVKPIDPSKIDTMLDENSVILDKNGKVIEKVQRSGLRTVVSYDEIDEDLKNAFIATEDRKFFQHNGFNYTRLIGAIIEAIKDRHSPRGTSTITQQLARNLYLPHIKSEKTLSRKIKEAYYTIQLEKNLTKEQIFEAYMNTIYLGSGAKGVQAAAQTYFSKNASDLTLVEAALIAGITQNPARHSPIITKKKADVKEDDYILDDSDEQYTIVFNKKCIDRFKDVLYFMKVSGKITEEEYNKAKNVDLKKILKPKRLNRSEISSYFTDLVKDEVINSLIKELDISKEDAYNMLYTQGLKIYSTLDLSMQKKLEAIYKNSKNFPNLVIRKDSSGNILSKTGSILLYKRENILNNENYLVIPKNHYKYDTNGNLILYKNKRLKFIPLYEKGKRIGISVAVADTYKIENNQVVIYKGGRVNIPAQYKSYDKYKNLVVSKEFLDSNPNFFKKDNHNNLLISKENYSISNKGSIQPQSAMVIIDYRTGEIKALVGGRDIKGELLYNRAIKPRQPGSAIKPLAVYTPAIDNGWTAASIIDDVPHYDRNGNRWPKNWYEKSSNPKYTGYKGLVTLRKALQFSMNVPAVKVAERLGVNTSMEYLEKMGISVESKKNPNGSLVKSGPKNDMNLSAMALGGMTKGLTPLEITSAYGSLANKGIYIAPHSFTKVTDRNGNIIIENKPIKNYVVSPQVAFIMTDMMKSGVDAGTGRKARLANMPVAGKTGTTSNNYDAWFVGYTPYYVAGVWIGNDLQIKLREGSGASAKLWKKVMEEIHKNLPTKQFEKPEGIIRMAVDTVSGKLPTKLSYKDPRGSTVRQEYFIEGTQPTEFDDVHVEVEVCSESNKLPTEFCPTTLIEKKVFISRPVPYNPSEHGGFVPADYKYEVPKTYCDIHTHNTVPSNPIDSLPPGTIILPNGTKLLPDGRKILPDGTIIFKDGTIVYPSENNNTTENTNSNIIENNENEINNN